MGLALRLDWAGVRVGFRARLMVGFTVRLWFKVRFRVGTTVRVGLW